VAQEDPQAGSANGAPSHHNGSKPKAPSNGHHNVGGYRVLRDLQREPQGTRA